jgi:hypothetical protein
MSTSFVRRALVAVVIVLSVVNSIFTYGTADLDGNDGPASAETLPGDGHVLGTLDVNDTIDFFSRTLVGGEVVQASIANRPGGNGTIDLRLLGPDEKVLVASDQVPSSGTIDLSYVTAHGQEGEFYLVVRLIDGGNATYELQAGFQMQDDHGTGTDAAGDIGNSTVLDGTSFVINGTVGPAGQGKGGSDKNDMYRFEVPPTHVVRLRASAQTPGSELWMEFHIDTMEVLPKFRGFVDSTTPLTNDKFEEEGGTYYLNVIWENGARTHYSVRLEVIHSPDLDPPDLYVDPEPVLSDLSLTFIGELEDDREIDQVEVMVNNGPPTVCQGTAKWSCEVSLSEGENIIVITGYDKAGNNVSQTFEHFVETVPVHIGLTVIAPQNGTKVDDEILTISGEVDSDHGPVVRCTTDDGLTQWGTSLNGSQWSCQVRLRDGANMVTVTAIDTAGNTNTTSLQIELDMKVIEEDNGPGTGVTIGWLMLALGLLVLLLFAMLRKSESGAKESGSRASDDSEE